MPFPYRPTHDSHAATQYLRTRIVEPQLSHIGKLAKQAKVSIGVGAGVVVILILGAIVYNYRTGGAVIPPER